MTLLDVFLRLDIIILFFANLLIISIDYLHQELQSLKRDLDKHVVPASAVLMAVGTAVTSMSLLATFCCNHSVLAAMCRPLPIPMPVAKDLAAELSDLTTASAFSFAMNS